MSSKEGLSASKVPSAFFVFASALLKALLTPFILLPSCSKVKSPESKSSTTLGTGKIKEYNLGELVLPKSFSLKPDKTSLTFVLSLLTWSLGVCALI